ncbi:MAG: DUF3783 domain-containing protein [Provencibacterium sp.]|nr:DUF3783 domain-containing protein [Provencibacterium sp.]
MERIRIPVRRLDAAALDEKLGVLAGSAPVQAGAPAQEPGLRDALIFKSLTRARLEEALAALNRVQAGRGALKAVLTPTNQTWSLRSLLGELEKEEALMNCYQRLHTRVQEADQRLGAQPAGTLPEALEKARKILQSDSPSLPELQEAEKELDLLLESLA